MFDIFLGTRVRTVVQIAMIVDYVLWREDRAKVVFMLRHRRHAGGR